MKTHQDRLHCTKKRKMNVNDEPAKPKDRDQIAANDFQKIVQSFIGEDFSIQVGTQETHNAKDAADMDVDTDSEGEEGNKDDFRDELDNFLKGYDGDLLELMKEDEVDEDLEPGCDEDESRTGSSNSDNSEGNTFKSLFKNLETFLAYVFFQREGGGR